MTAYIVTAAVDGEPEVEVYRSSCWEGAHGYCSGASGAWQYDSATGTYTAAGDPAVYRVREIDAPQLSFAGSYYVSREYVVWGPQGRVASFPLQVEADAEALRLDGEARERAAREAAEVEDDVKF